eukprot:TRINITY_DN10118_c0_g1_i2.p1 TRINITY_DN10118_c0_g1~~TRINITY_DN10118_c0_g1_i2.p1  ORF type:complete len:183 (-),score=46.52 TRINITY_DN10118_c0_g1_i2:339-887(-)
MCIRDRDTHTEGNVMRILKGSNNNSIAPTHPLHHPTPGCTNNGNHNNNTCTSTSSSSSAAAAAASCSLSDSILTSVVVAHRLNVIRDADCIFVLNQHGQLIEKGSHEELMAITIDHSSSSMYTKEQLELEAAALDESATPSLNHASALMHVVDPEEEDDFPGQYRRMWINQNVSPDVNYSKV